MAVTQRVSVEKVGKAFVTALHGVDVARDAWVSAASEGFDLWLHVESIDLASERDLYALVDRMYERFPSSRFSLHILNPETFVNLVTESIVPARAHHVGLRASA